MRFHDNGSYFSVSVSRSEVEAFARAYIRDGNRCIGKVYIDTGTPNRPRAIGWVFLKRRFSTSRA